MEMHLTYWKEKLAQLHRQKNFPIWCFLFLLISGYTLFLTSTVWYPENQDYVAPTKYYEQHQVGVYQISVTDWKYSKKDHAMQIIFEKQNREILDEKLYFGAMERTGGELEVKAVLDEPDYLILRIENIPENWKEISLRVGNTENEDSMKKFYTNVNRVEETKKLALKDEKGYLMDRLLAQKRQADQELEEIQKKITKLLQENEDLSKKEEEIKAKTYLTQAEQKKGEETLIRAENQILINQETIEHLEEEAVEKENDIDSLKMKIDELK